MKIKKILKFDVTLKSVSRIIILADTFTPNIHFKIFYYKNVFTYKTICDAVNKTSIYFIFTNMHIKVLN